MNRTLSRMRVEAFIKEFPWLPRYIPNKKGRIKSIRVSRVDLDLIDSRLQNMCDENIFLLSEAGEVVSRVGETVLPIQPSIWNLWSKKPKVVFDRKKRVFEHLLTVDGTVLKRAKLVLSVSYGPDIVIYKLPKGYDDLSSWINKLRVDSEAEVRKSIEEVEALPK